MITLIYSIITHKLIIKSKYINHTINIFHNEIKWLNIKYSFQILKHVAPIGISFYTMEALMIIHYVILTTITTVSNVK